MDVCESARALRKHILAAAPRQPLVPAEKNNAVIPRSPSRSTNKSPSSSSSAGSRRCPSPSITRTVPTSSQLVLKRAQSAERKRPSTPPSPPSPSTPIHGSPADVQLLSKRMIGGRPESLWPSTMRSLSVSFQSDAFSIPVSKKEKPVSSSLSDRTLRPSSNFPHKQAETQNVARKPTPERKKSPLRGRCGHDQSENFKPVDGSSRSQVVDQHRWPSRVGAKASSNPLSCSTDLTDKRVPTLNKPLRGSGLSSTRATMVETTNKPLQKSISGVMRQSYVDGRSREEEFEANSANDNSTQESAIKKVVSSSLPGTKVTTNRVVRYDSPTLGPRPSSPSRTPVVFSVTRGVSPSRIRPSTPPPRGISTSRIRPSNSSPPNVSTSVLSFIADFKKGKKAASYIEGAHQLRLLYNRHLQWRFANARAEAVLYNQGLTAERALHGVRNTTLNLWDSVIRKRINLQQLKLELKLISIMNDQMSYLNEWAVLERSHNRSLSGVIDDLEASTLRVPVTGGAKADVGSLNGAICSAVEVMQAMGASICSLLPRVEILQTLVFELAIVAAKEKAMLDECVALLASTAALQVQEQSLWTHLIQMKQGLEKGCQF
ncbi:AUGMIN subunit 8-like [Momordica charantia]|uniref:AUGMIN subunit 8-like n=1 Tax=Momordica charantia TaxID=3673 RepID=A0A6J1C2I1_MOMCH|nr:AUGMIN subunit 8-like [Momordica charantia]XP_022135370.1 AUGMIN subunit 8-like [Momordica charantia]XP_022135371.1 AUGMIN subunit 8-like [Momordica charantia]XP_022135372.1 AUGMIN subunit 8-like [Momordica charantia]XP_022135373.1 AUGMIN subunit 8-like [Momordica charantia]